MHKAYDFRISYATLERRDDRLRCAGVPLGSPRPPCFILHAAAPEDTADLRGVGQEWERLAEKHLKEAGYTIRARNFRTRVGEIDFVAQDGNVLCFVEVKGRHGTGFGMPEEAVNPKNSAGSSAPRRRISSASVSRTPPVASTWSQSFRMTRRRT